MVAFSHAQQQRNKVRQLKVMFFLLDNDDNGGGGGY